MGKCSPIAAKILSTFERAEAGNDVAGSDFAEFFLMVVERRLPPNLAALFREAQYDRWLMDIAGDLGPRPGAREAHRKLNFYASTNYPRDVASGEVPTGENGTLFLMLTSRGGDFLTEGRILKRLRARRGQK
jgi:hypothetical protein